MQKVKITLPTSKWGTVKSKYKPESKYVGNDEFTANSYNFITNTNGAIEKRPTDVQYNSSTLTNTGKDQFEAIFASGIHHEIFLDGGSLKYTTGDGVFSTAAMGYTAAASMEYSMYQNRVYFDNSVDTPSVYDLTASYGGVTYSVPQVKNMGALVPVSAPAFASDTVGGSVPVGGHTYKVTYLYYDLEESNGSSASVLHTVSSPNQTVHLTSVPVGGYGVTARNIYRDNNNGDYRLIGTLEDNTTTTFADTASSGTTVIPTSNNLPPVFSYITLNLSRLFVAGVTGTPTTLYWSLPDLPDIFDPNNFLVCNPKDPITGVAVYQGITYVFNRHSFGQILGNTDDTFFYQEFPGAVGCVDNRSIQVRTIDGVPVLIFLSDKGFYKCNGSSVDYISDPIEDLVNLNLQQVNFVTGSNNQSTQADFAAGTASPSIDLNTDPGTITTIDPISTYQSESDWEGGASVVNVATLDGTNTLKVPLAYAPTLASGTLTGQAYLDGSNIKLPVASNWTGESVTGTSRISTGVVAFAYPIVIPRAGVINTFTLTAETGSTATGFPVLKIYADAGGSPGTVLYTSGTVVVPGTFTVNPSLSVAAGTYWLGMDAGAGSLIGVYTAFSGGTPKVFVAGSWQNAVIQPGGGSHTNAYTFTQTAVASSGTWASGVYDSKSSVAVPAVVTNAATYPTNTSATLYVDASNDPTLSTGVTTVSFANPNGANAVTTTNLRYWRLRYAVASTDDRATPSVAAATLTFSQTGTWISQPIDCTTDVTSYNAITLTDNVPVGTSVAVTIATSTDNITYSAYVAVGSAVVRRYVKVKVVLSTTSGDTTTPSVSLVQFTRNLTATFTSSVINIGQVPTGWGVFQNQAAANGGTFAFYMRSAASSGALSAATFYAVSNGVFPNVSITPLQYTQWKVILTAAPSALPTVDSVTVNWTIGSSQSPIRAASLFYNKTYYLAAAEVGQTVNNIVLVYDFEGNWRVFRDINVNSLGLFYNQPFYFDAVRKNFYQWLIAPTGTGTAITMDVRTKAFDLGDVGHLKNIRSLRITGMNTGTTIQAYYSVDRGVTWVSMLNVNGTVNYTSSTDGNKFSEYFVPNYDAGSITSGSTIMYRVTSVDAFPCVILEIEPVLYVRSGKYLGVAL